MRKRIVSLTFTIVDFLFLTTEKKFFKIFRVVFSLLYSKKSYGLKTKP